KIINYMFIKKKYLLIFYILYSSQIFSQSIKDFQFFKSIPLYNTWSKLEIPAFLESEGKILIKNKSAGLDLKIDPQGHFWIKSVSTTKQLFFLEILAENTPHILIFERTDLGRINSMTNQSNDTIFCNLTVKKILDRKLYISEKTNSDEIFILLNNIFIPFRRSGNNITINLPPYIDQLEKSYVRIYTTNKNQNCKELIIPIKYGKLDEFWKSFTSVEGSAIQDSSLHLNKNINPVVQSPIKSKDLEETANEKETKIPTKLFSFSGYVDVYYGLYSDSIGTNNYQKFPVTSPKSNVFGLNIAQISGQYTSQKLRAIATFHYGDIPSIGWSPVFNILQEANAGFRITNKIWIDAGLFKTHIGSEAILPKDNIISSLAITTFYEPFLQAGVKLSYIPNDKYQFCLHILNGYNIFEENNKSKSFGLTFNYYFDKGSFGYFNLIGDESPDDRISSHLRMLHNVVFTYKISPKLKTLIGFDFITQQNSVILNDSEMASAFGGLITFKYQLKPKLGIYARGETFNDKNGFLTGIIQDSKNKNTGFKVNGITLGFEFNPMENAFIRLEGRTLIMDKDQKIFHNSNENTNTNIRKEIAVNMGVWF
ncbi:MAG: outer membrane beta-barrel protein, partial [Saprospiraceae bacterium]